MGEIGRLVLSRDWILSLYLNSDKEDNVNQTYDRYSSRVCIGGSRGAAGASLLPQQDPILSFSHVFLPKSAPVGGQRPPQREILDPKGLSYPNTYKISTIFQYIIGKIYYSKYAANLLISLVQYISVNLVSRAFKAISG